MPAGPAGTPFADVSEKVGFGPDGLAGHDKGDHLHPNAAGYKAMADSIDLNLLLGK